MAQNELDARGYRRVLGLGYFVPQLLVPSPEISFRYNRAIESRSKSSCSQFIQEDCRLVRPTRLVRFNVFVAEESGSIEFRHSESPCRNYQASRKLRSLGLREDSQSHRVPQKIVQAIRAQARRWLFEQWKAFVIQEVRPIYAVSGKNSRDIGLRHPL